MDSIGRSCLRQVRAGVMWTGVAWCGLLLRLEALCARDLLPLR